VEGVLTARRHHNHNPRIDPMIKCTFLLPLHDNDGVNFAANLLANIRHRVLAEFGGLTVAGQSLGYYTMADGSVAKDETATIVVCVPDKGGVDRLRAMVAEFGVILGQESMYFEVSPDTIVEFVSTSPETPPPPNPCDACPVKGISFHMPC